jgi:hypothetical protein
MSMLDDREERRTCRGASVIVRRLGRLVLYRPVVALIEEEEEGRGFWFMRGLVAAAVLFEARRD